MHNVQCMYYHTIFKPILIFFISSIHFIKSSFALGTRSPPFKCFIIQKIGICIMFAVIFQYTYKHKLIKLIQVVYIVFFRCFPHI